MEGQAGGIGRKGKTLYAQNGIFSSQIPLLCSHFSPFLIVTSPSAQLQEKHKRSLRSLSLRLSHKLITQEIGAPGSCWLLRGHPPRSTGQDASVREQRARLMMMPGLTNYYIHAQTKDYKISSQQDSPRQVGKAASGV